MNRYVEWDGEWVVQPPGIMTDVSIVVLVLPAERDVLRDRICRVMIDEPSGGEATARPLLPAAILFGVKIGKGYPVNHPEQGFQSEYDLGFLVPVVLSVELSEFAALVPYIYVNSWVGMIAGREIFGFPKQMAKFRSRAGNLTVQSVVAPDHPGDEAIEKTIIEVAGLSTASTTLLSGNVLEQIIRRIFDHLGRSDDVVREAVLPLANATRLSARYAFLKQFRDAADTVSACYQAIVRAPVEVTVKKAAVITSPVVVNLTPRPRLAIAANLGLIPRSPGSSAYEATLGFELQVEMHISPGRVLWSA